MKLRNGRMVLQAKDIPDESFLEAIEATIEARTTEWGLDAKYASRWDIHDLLGHHIPEKVVLAKAAQLIKRGIIDGCTCTCRGDFEIVKPKPEPAPLVPVLWTQLSPTTRVTISVHPDSLEAT